MRELAALGVAGYINEYSAVQHILPSLAPHLFPDNFNRRGSPRVVLGIPIAYRFGNTIAAALTLNLSRGGIAIRTTSPLERGAEVKVRFRMPGSKKDIDVDGRVCWSDRGRAWASSSTGSMPSIRARSTTSSTRTSLTRSRAPKRERRRHRPNRFQASSSRLQEEPSSRRPVEGG